MRASRVWLACGSLLALTITQTIRAELPATAPRDTVNSTNFVVAAPSGELAAAILQRAEQLRDEIATQWLGEPIPPGIGTAVISVRISAKENSGRTWPGANLQRPTYMVWLKGSKKEVTGPLLAHEIAHVVLSTRFPGQLPPWANEGVASLLDGEERTSIRHRILTWQADTGNWPFVGDVLTSQKIAASDQADYALASSLVEFLLTQGDRSTLLEFAVYGKRNGWETAIREYYQIDGTKGLQQAWRAWAAQQLNRHHVAVVESRRATMR